MTTPRRTIYVFIVVTLYRIHTAVDHSARVVVVAAWNATAVQLQSGRLVVSRQS
jgi:hypothetical protein